MEPTEMLEKLREARELAHSFAAEKLLDEVIAVCINALKSMPREPMTHELKCDQDPWEAMWKGEKTFEFRRCDDRDFRVGDMLRLIDPSGRVLRRQVTYILHAPDYGVPEGYCVMGLK